MRLRTLATRLASLTLVALCCPGCDRRSSGEPAALVAASNAYLESAVRDLLGDDRPVLALAEPGMCPGHFDIRPSQIERLRACRLLLRFDFQESLDRKLAELARGGLRIVPVVLEGGLCEPDTYRAACKQVADALVERGMLGREAADQRLIAVEQWMAGNTAWARQSITKAELQGRAVVTSEHQAAFCRFLGLDVVATFTGADTASVREIDAAIRKGKSAKLVVANLPEGRGLADALAERLGAKVVVFGNFPDAASHHGRFDGLFRDNVGRLIAAAAP